MNVGVLDSLPEVGQDIDPESYTLCAQYDGEVSLFLFLKDVTCTLQYLATHPE